MIKEVKITVSVRNPYHLIHYCEEVYASLPHLSKEDLLTIKEIIDVWPKDEDFNKSNHIIMGRFKEAIEKLETEQINTQKTNIA